MIGQRIGYVRVSSFDQNPERQLDNVNVDKVFTESASGKDTQRPQLDALLTFVRGGSAKALPWPGNGAHIKAARGRSMTNR